MRFRIMTVVLLAVLVIACAGSSENKERKPRTSYNLIDTAQIEAWRGTDAYELIQSTHANWLRSVKASSFSYETEIFPVVYVGDMKTDLSYLESLPTSAVLKIQRLNSFEATSKYGPRHEAGAIIVTLK